MWQRSRGRGREEEEGAGGREGEERERGSGTLWTRVITSDSRTHLALDLAAIFGMGWIRDLCLP